MQQAVTGGGVTATVPPKRDLVGLVPSTVTVACPSRPHAFVRHVSHFVTQPFPKF